MYYSIGQFENQGGMMCAADYNPVCGSNGQTYSNACNAGSVSHTPGACKTLSDFLKDASLYDNRPCNKQGIMCSGFYSARCVNGRWGCAKNSTHPDYYKNKIEKERAKAQLEIAKIKANYKRKSAKISPAVAIGLGLVASGGIFYWLKSTGKI
jgi:hypothetical protein